MDDALDGEHSTARPRPVNGPNRPQRISQMEAAYSEKANSASGYRRTLVLRVACLVAAIAASALVFSISVTSFFHIKEAVLAILLVPLTAFSVASRRTGYNGFKPFLPLVLLAMLPFVYSIAPNFPQVSAAMYREQARLAVLILYGVLTFDLMREERFRTLTIRAFLITATIAALLAIAQRIGFATSLLPEFEDSPDPLYSVFGNSGLLGGYLAMAIPLAIHRIMTSHKFPMSLLVLAVVTPALVLSGSRAAWIGSAIGTLLILPYNGMNLRRAAAIIVVIVCSSAATLVQFQETRPGEWLREEKQDTIRLRFWFWDGAIRMAADHPVAGVGPGNFAYWSPHYQGDALKSGYRHISNEAHTHYAHNEPLHFAAETGLIGIALCAWMLIRLIRCRGPEWGGLAAALIFALFHFPLHSAPHVLMMVLFATMLFARADGGEEEISLHPGKKGDQRAGLGRGISRRLSIGVAAMAASLFFTAFTIWDVLLPSIALRDANTRYFDGEPSNEAYEKAVTSGRFHPEAHSNYANALLQQGELEQARVQLEKALEGQDTGDLHLALGFIALQQGDPALAQTHIKAAIHRWPNNETAQGYLKQAESVVIDRE